MSGRSRGEDIVDQQDIPAGHVPGRAGSNDKRALEVFQPVVAIKPMLTYVDDWTLGWLFVGGLFYTGGTWFYMHQRLRYAHAIWHLFVLAGSVSHYVAIVGLVAVPRVAA